MPLSFGLGLVIIFFESRFFLFFFALISWLLFAFHLSLAAVVDWDLIGFGWTVLIISLAVGLKKKRLNELQTCVRKLEPKIAIFMVKCIGLEIKSSRILHRKLMVKYDRT